MLRAYEIRCSMDDSTGLLLTDLRKDDRPGVMVTVVVVIVLMTDGAPRPYPGTRIDFSEELDQEIEPSVVVFVHVQRGTE